MHYTYGTNGLTASARNHQRIIHSLRRGGAGAEWRATACAGGEGRGGWWGARERASARRAVYRCDVGGGEGRARAAGAAAGGGGGGASAGARAARRIRRAGHACLEPPRDGFQYYRDNWRNRRCVCVNCDGGVSTSNWHSHRQRQRQERRRGRSCVWLLNKDEEGKFTRGSGPVC
ncbi:Protein of unknown function [Gryllus bimaculatus]|nr:Protein of unknown function [Gryllus bimaculatus]